MKLWKWIIGLLAMLGGAAALASTQKKKEYDKKVKVNKEKIKVVQAKTRKVEEAKVKTKKAKKTVKNFEDKYRKKSPGRPKKKA